MGGAQEAMVCMGGDQVEGGQHTSASRETRGEDVVRHAARGPGWSQAGGAMPTTPGPGAHPRQLGAWPGA